MVMSTRKKWIALVGVLVLPVLIVLAMVRMGAVSLNTSSSDDETPVDLRSLAALPYTNYVVEAEERKEKAGVMLYDEALAYDGVNLYCNHYEKTSGAYLIDMTGRVVHQWHAADSSMWKLVTVDKSGNVYAVLDNDERVRLVKMDWNSTVLFELPGRFHHDIRLLDDGSVVTLKREQRVLRHKGQAVRILDDYMVRISSAGRVVKSISLFDLMRGHSVVQRVLDLAIAPGSARRILDILHTNTAEVLDRDIPGFCRKGNILFCMRNLDLILVWDYESNEIVWQHDGDGEWQHPHEPTLTTSGNLLIFDNGRLREWSRIIEMDPITRQIVWEYRGDPPTSFFTARRGSTQRFVNGNTLVTESDTGRVFEITEDGKLVWEWYNPLFSNQGRSIVYKMKRFEPGVVDAWMAKAGRTSADPKAVR